MPATDDDPMPDGLRECDHELWAAACHAIDLPGAADRTKEIALWLRRELRLQAQVNRLENAVALLSAKIDMACARLEGTVDGQPPHAGNFLQRIDELVRVEAAAKKQRTRR